MNPITSSPNSIAPRTLKVAIEWLHSFGAKGEGGSATILQTSTLWTSSIGSILMCGAAPKGPPRLEVLREAIVGHVRWATAFHGMVGGVNLGDSKTVEMVPIWKTRDAGPAVGYSGRMPNTATNLGHGLLSMSESA